MENNPFDTSFIPELPKNVVSENNKKIVEYNLAFILSLVFFFSSLAVAGGLYYYRSTIEERIDQKKIAIADSEKKINIDAIKELDLTNTRLKTAKNMLKSHITLAPVFDLIEKQTVASVGYNEFSFEYKEGVPHVILKAETGSFASAYLQEEQLKRQNNVIKNVKVSNMHLNELSGVVEFDIDIEVDPKLLDYSRYFADRLSPVEATSTPMQGTVSTSTATSTSP